MTAPCLEGRRFDRQGVRMRFRLGVEFRGCLVLRKGFGGMLKERAGTSP